MAAGRITIPAFAETKDGVRHFFGTRHGPAAPTLPGANRVISVKQVHGTDALILDRPVGAGEDFAGGQGRDQGKEGWDALVTNQPGVLLTIRTADCVPVLVRDPKRGAVAAIHAGWRGAVAGIVPLTLAAMRETFGSDVPSVQVGIGPSVGACCYEVDRPVVERLSAAFADWSLVTRATGPGKWMLDLRELIRRQVQALGVEPPSVRTVNVCTVCHPDLFYSYRREGHARRTMVSGIMLTRKKKR